MRGQLSYLVGCCVTTKAREGGNSVPLLSRRQQQVHSRRAELASKESRPKAEPSMLYPGFRAVGSQGTTARLAR